MTKLNNFVFSGSFLLWLWLIVSLNIKIVFQWLHIKALRLIELLKAYFIERERFPGYNFWSKPDIIILNVTLLKKSILSLEIFADQSYKVFWISRSIKSHQPDQCLQINSNEMLIAIRSDLDIELSNCKL